MVRTGIFIGVDKTGGLQKLSDAASGAKRMYDWALAQGMTGKLITDAGGKKVTPDQICEAVEEIVNGAGADQLILYFAGHGVNINRSEHWLLTDAPARTSAAVNVAGSVDLARYCGIGYVAIISDACRVAPEGIQAQWVRGVDVFPNEGASDRAKPVDQFFACVLGRTAAEIKDPAVAAGSFCALYTNVLLEALNGTHPDALESGDDGAYYVKPVKLEDCLEREVPLRVRALNLEKKVNQNPEAIITAHPNWLSRVTTAPRAGVRAILRDARPPDVRMLSRNLVRAAVERDPAGLNEEMSGIRARGTAGADRLAGTVASLAAPFGPDHFETGCGVKVRGAAITNFTLRSGTGELLGPERNILRLQPGPDPVSVVLRFSGNTGAVIPAIPGYLASLTLDEGELVEVAYEPSAHTPDWQQYRGRAREIRTLRGVAASATRHGRFRLDNVEDPLSIARKMQYAKFLDPTLAIYAAYAYHDLQRPDLIQEMAGFMREVLRGAFLFDLALLGRSLTGETIDHRAGVVPFVPMFSQAWALLGANRVRLHPALEGIERTIRESVWTMFEGKGVDMLERALASGEVR